MVLIGETFDMQLNVGMVVMYWYGAFSGMPLYLLIDLLIWGGIALYKPFCEAVHTVV